MATSMDVPMADAEGPGGVDQANAAADAARAQGVPKLPQGDLGLSGIRNALIRQEETIIFGLIERSQFAHNTKVYAKGAFPFFSPDGKPLSFMEHFLLETEKVHARCSRFQCPDENPFFPGWLPLPEQHQVSWPEVLIPNTVNLNSRIMSLYVERVVPQIAGGGLTSDDCNYGSTATCDIAVLQAISKRIHFGKYVAEAKYRSETEHYQKLIAEHDAEGIMRALTNTAVEEKLLRRVHHKARQYGSEIEDDGGTCQQGAELKVDPEVIVAVYRDFLIPLTKDVEVEYLLRRCGPMPVASVACAHRAAHAYWGLASADAGVKIVSTTPTVSHAFEEVRSGQVGKAMVPFESLESSILKSTVLEFVKELEWATKDDPAAATVGKPRPLRVASTLVCGEIYAPSAFVLVRQEGAAMHEVAAAAEVLFMCQDALKLCHGGLVQARVSSAEEALQRTRLSRHVGALVPERVASPLKGSAAAWDGPKLEFESIEGKAVDHFLVLGRAPCPAPTGRDKTMILFTLSDAAGTLVQALKAFETFSVNLSAINSFLGSIDQEARGGTFLVQADGHMEEKQLAGALQRLSEASVVGRICVLGSFPAHSGGPALGAAGAGLAAPREERGG